MSKKYSFSTFRFLMGLPFAFLAAFFAWLANWVSGNQLDVNFNDHN